MCPINHKVQELYYVVTHQFGLAAVAQGHVVKQASKVVPGPAKSQVFDRDHVAVQRGVVDPEHGILFRMQRVRTFALNVDHRSLWFSLILLSIPVAANVRST